MTYKEEYKKFLEEYKRGLTGGAEIGEMIARMAQYFSELNLQLADAEIAYNKKAAEVEQQTDDNGKPLSSAKAKVYTDSTPEAAVAITAKAHVNNVEQCLNALKSLQKGVLNEYSHLGNS